MAAEEEGGRVDFFVPLGASGQHQDLERQGTCLPMMSFLCVSEVPPRMNPFNAWINGSFLFTTVMIVRNTVTLYTVISLSILCIL